MLIHPGDVERREPPIPVRARETIERLALTDVARTRLLGLIEGREALLDYLPLADLRDVVIEGDTLELRFDFEGKKSREVVIPAALYVALDPRTKRPVTLTTEENTLIVRSSIRFELGPDGISAVREGDLKVVYGIFRVNLTAHTETHRRRRVTDEQGRVLLEVDAGGRPVTRGGDFVPLTSNEWLIIEARGKRLEVPLSRPQAMSCASRAGLDGGAVDHPLSPAGSPERLRTFERRCCAQMRVVGYTRPQGGLG
jgi:hypothetical protein